MADTQAVADAEVTVGEKMTGNSWWTNFKSEDETGNAVEKNAADEKSVTLAMKDAAIVTANKDKLDREERIVGI